MVQTDSTATTCCGSLCWDTNTDIRQRLVSYFDSIRNPQHKSGNTTQRLLLNCANGKYFSNCGLNRKQLLDIHCILGSEESKVRTLSRIDLLRLMNEKLSDMNKQTIYEKQGDLSRDEYANRAVPDGFFQQIQSAFWLQYRRLRGENTDIDDTNRLLKSPDEWEVLAASDEERGLTCQNNTLSKLAPKRLHIFHPPRVNSKGVTESGNQNVAYIDIKRHYRRSQWKSIWDKQTDMLDNRKYARETAEAIQNIKREIGNELYGYNFSKIFPVEPISEDEFRTLFQGLEYLNNDKNLDQLYKWADQFFVKFDKYKEDLLPNNLVRNTELTLVRPLEFHGTTYKRFQTYPGVSRIEDHQIIIKNLVRFVRGQKVNGRKLFMKPSNILVKMQVDGENFSKFEKSVESIDREKARQKGRRKSNGMIVTKFVPLNKVYQSHGLDDPRFYSAQRKNLERMTSILLGETGIVDLMNALKIGDTYFISQDILQRAEVFKQLSSAKPVEVMCVQKVTVHTPTTDVLQKDLTNEYYTLDGVGRVWALKQGFELIGIDPKNIMLEVDVYQLSYSDWSTILSGTMMIRAIDGHVDDSVDGLIPWKMKGDSWWDSSWEGHRESAISDGVWRYSNTDPEDVCESTCPLSGGVFKKGDEYPFARKCGEAYCSSSDGERPKPFGILEVANDIYSNILKTKSNVERQRVAKSIIMKQFKFGKAIVKDSQLGHYLRSAKGVISSTVRRLANDTRGFDTPTIPSGTGFNMSKPDSDMVPTDTTNI